LGGSRVKGEVHHWERLLAQTALCAARTPAGQMCDVAFRTAMFNSALPVGVRVV